MSLVDIILFFKQKTAYEMRISDWSSDVCSSDLAESFGQIGTRFGLFSRVAGLVGGPRRSRLIVGHAALPQRLTLGRGLRLLVRFVAVNLYALRRGGEIGSPLELGIAADLDRSPPVFLREPDQIGKGVWVFRLDAIRRDGRDRLFVVRASIELVANPEEPRVQLGGHFHRTPAACLAFLACAGSFDILNHVSALVRLHQ